MNTSEGIRGTGKNLGMVKPDDEGFQCSIFCVCLKFSKKKKKVAAARRAVVEMSGHGYAVSARERTKRCWAQRLGFLTP